jgi:ribosomal protein S18 acetylase RimI-like enzyme
MTSVSITSVPITSVSSLKWPDGYNCRIATVADVPQLRKLNTHNMPEQYPARFWRANIEQSLHLVVYAATNIKKIVAYVATMTLDTLSTSIVAPDTVPGTRMLYSIAVELRHRKQGLGLALIKALRHMISEDLVLHVRVDNFSAKSLYNKSGFILVRTIAGYYRGTDGQEMRLKGNTM